MTIGTSKKILNKIRPVVFELQSVKILAHLTLLRPWCPTFQGQIFFEGRYWPNKSLQWLWFNSDHFGRRYKFLKFPQWWEIGIFGIFWDFFGPDPIIRLSPKSNGFRIGWTPICEKNLEAIPPKLWPVGGEQISRTDRQTRRHADKRDQPTYLAKLKISPSNEIAHRATLGEIWSWNFFICFTLRQSDKVSFR